MFGFLALTIASQLPVEPPSVVKDWWQGEHRSIPFRISLADSKGKEFNISAGRLSIRRESFDISIRNVSGETSASYASGKLWLGTVGVEKFSVPGTLTRGDALNESLEILLSSDFTSMLGYSPRQANEPVAKPNGRGKVTLPTNEFKGAFDEYHFDEKTGEPKEMIRRFRSQARISPTSFDILTWRCQFGRDGQPKFNSFSDMEGIFFTWDESIFQKLGSVIMAREIPSYWESSRRTYSLRVGTSYRASTIVVAMYVLGDKVTWDQGNLVESWRVRGKK